MTNMLSDLVVIDLTRALAGPHAGMMLGDLGARVIKVESPGTGDDSRSWGPPFVGPEDALESTYFLSCNRNKESVTADLKSDDGKDLLTRLVAHADVLMENFRPGVLDRLGFSVERLHEINPRLIVLSITGFGHDGPEGGRAGYDQIAQGEAGLMSLTGPSPDEPTKVGVPIGDLLAGMYGAYGILAALHERNSTGRGRVVRTSLLAAVVGVHAFQGTRWTVAGEVPRGMGNHHPAIAPYGLFHTADVPIQIACGSDSQWRVLANVLDLDQARYASNRERVALRDELVPAMERALAADTSESWLTRLSEIGIPAGKVRTLDDTYTWDQTCPRAWWSTSSTPASARSRYRVRRCVSTTTPTPGPARSTCLPRGSVSTTSRCAPGWTRWTVAERLSAKDLLDLVLDAGSWVSWDTPPVRGEISPAYAEELKAAQEKSGLDESVLTGEGLLRGRRVAVMACEFRFLAGSIGVDAATRLVAAIERATAEGLPLLAAPVSGGTRMQEGTVAFVQMVKISAAIATHKSAGLPYLVYLRHPTTGGVMASWGSLGHVTVAEPGALVGFLGPRVYEALYDRTFPPGVQTSENLYAHGLIDAVVPPEEIAAIVDRALNVLLAPRDELVDLPDPVDEEVPDVDAWESITRSRSPERVGVRRLLRYAATDVIPLNGTGQGEADPGLLIALARFGGSPCVFLGQDRRGQTEAHPLGPGALREARRGMRLAAELRLPLMTVVDTPGAALSVEAEEGGLAGEIARCLADLVTLDAPTLTLLLGEGTGGGALALLPADRVIAAQHGWLSPLPPEGASAIVHRDLSHAADMARAQGVRSLDLRAAGIVDRIVVEKPDAAEEPEAFCARLSDVLRYELAELLHRDRTTLVAERMARYQRVGGSF